MEKEPNDQRPTPIAERLTANVHRRTPKDQRRIRAFSVQNESVIIRKRVQDQHPADLETAISDP
ncbi:MAG: hypothetical protein AAF317_09075, partial [Pseudomonadota bacterium]